MPVNYCYFILHVQIEPKLTIVGVLSVNCHTPLWSTGPVYLYIHIYIIIIVCQSLAAYTNSLECVCVCVCVCVCLMYLAHFYTNTVNTLLYPQKLSDCGQCDHMTTCI